MLWCLTPMKFETQIHIQINWICWICWKHRTIMKTYLCVLVLGFRWSSSFLTSHQPIRCGLFELKNVSAPLLWWMFKYVCRFSPCFSNEAELKVRHLTNNRLFYTMDDFVWCHHFLKSFETALLQLSHTHTPIAQTQCNANSVELTMSIFNQY